MYTLLHLQQNACATLEFSKYNVIFLSRESSKAQSEGWERGSVNDVRIGGYFFIFTFSVREEVHEKVFKMYHLPVPSSPLMTLITWPKMDHI